MLTHVVWDWNGTLFDDLHTCVAVANQLLGEFDLPGLTGVDDYHAKFRFPIIEYYADLGFDTSPRHLRGVEGESDRAQACAAISHVSEKPAGATPSPRISRAHALT